MMKGTVIGTKKEIGDSQRISDRKRDSERDCEKKSDQKSLKADKRK